MGLRNLAKRILGVERRPAYYLPWLTRPHLQCALVLSNVESRFKIGYNRGSFPLLQMMPETGPEPSDAVILCYCTMLTVGEFRRTCAAARWPLPGKENTGKLCTGCLGDFLYCQERFETRAREARSVTS